MLITRKMLPAKDPNYSAHLLDVILDSGALHSEAEGVVLYHLRNLRQFTAVLPFSCLPLNQTNRLLVLIIRHLCGIGGFVCRAR